MCLVGELKFHGGVGTVCTGDVVATCRNHFCHLMLVRTTMENGVPCEIHNVSRRLPVELNAVVFQLVLFETVETENKIHTQCQLNI